MARMFTPGLHPLWVELAVFLGDSFRPEWCSDEDTKVFTEARRYPDVMTFYRKSEILCYQGIGYWLEGWKRKAHAILLQLGMGSLQILDYGCGVGQDGLCFLEYGYDVAFADLQSRSFDFCQWRLQQRAYTYAQCITLDTGDPLPYAQVVWCMDVVEHLPPEEQPLFLDLLASYGTVVITNLIYDTRADGVIHYPVDRHALHAHVKKTGPAIMLDAHTMTDGNVTSLLLYGNGVLQNPEGALIINPRKVFTPGDAYVPQGTPRHLS